MCDCDLERVKGTTTYAGKLCDMHAQLIRDAALAEREACATLIEGHEELGEARLVLAEQIRKTTTLGG